MNLILSFWVMDFFSFLLLDMNLILFLLVMDFSFFFLLDQIPRMTLLDFSICVFSWTFGLDSCLKSDYYSDSAFFLSSASFLSFPFSPSSFSSPFSAHFDGLLLPAHNLPSDLLDSEKTQLSSPPHPKTNLIPRFNLLIPTHTQSTFRISSTMSINSTSPTFDCSWLQIKIQAIYLPINDANLPQFQEELVAHSFLSYVLNVLSLLHFQECSGSCLTESIFLLFHRFLVLLPRTIFLKLITYILEINTLFHRKVVFDKENQLAPNLSKVLLVQIPILQTLFVLQKMT